MSIEAGVVIGINGEGVYWHLPGRRTGSSLPDSQELWDFIWENRDSISGFAHSHPGTGVPGPSYTDVTTFEGIESALGKRLHWWITSEDRLVVASWRGPDKLEYEVQRAFEKPSWLERLRQESEYRSKF